jgi:copper oxidase (laccase) domain-containing protein
VSYATQNTLFRILIYMSLIYYVSTISDKSMKSPDQNFATVLPARRSFLQANDIDPADTTLVQVTYETDDFCRYVTLSDSDKGDGITRDATIEADALVVTKPNHALLLPLADCIGAVIHDSIKDILMISHLGRHNLVQNGGTKCINYLAEEYGCKPENLTIWLSPAAGKDTYPLFDFDDRSMHDVASEQLIAAGVLVQNITASPIDVATDEKYFSHSQFLKHNRASDGRFAIIAVLR